MQVVTRLSQWCLSSRSITTTNGMREILNTGILFGHSLLAETIRAEKCLVAVARVVSCKVFDGFLPPFPCVFENKTQGTCFAHPIPFVGHHRVWFGTWRGNVRVEFHLKSSPDLFCSSLNKDLYYYYNNNHQHQHQHQQEQEQEQQKCCLRSVPTTPKNWFLSPWKGSEKRIKT